MPMRFIRPIAALVWKDLLLELRSRDIVVSALVFGFLVVVVFNFALKVTPQRVAELAPGILWVAFAFAGTLAMSRAFVREREQGGLEGLLLSPVSRDAIFLGKALVSFLFMLVIEAALLPVLAVLLNFTAFTWTLFAPSCWPPWALPPWAPCFRPLPSRPAPGRLCCPCSSFP